MITELKHSCFSTSITSVLVAFKYPEVCDWGVCKDDNITKNAGTLKYLAIFVRNQN
jgi:hypothetical protein